MEAPQKLNTELPYNAATPPLGIYLKESKSTYKRDTRTATFTAALFTMAKLQNQPRCQTTDEWIKKIWCYVYTMKKNEIMSFAGKWIELEIIMLSKISQAQKAKYLMFLLIFGVQTQNDDDKNRKFSLRCGY
jgi:hypothetical protein